MPDHSVLKPEKLARLKAAVDQSRRKGKIYRDNRLAVWKQIVGRWYSEDGSKLTQPLPLMRLALDVIGRLVAPNNPRVNVTTFIPSWRGKAFELKLALNFLLDRLYFRETIQAVFSDALISAGVVKVGMSRGPDYDYDGESYNAGVPFIDRVDLDDFICDLGAKSFRECAYIGNYHDVPLDWVKSARHMSKKARDAVQAGSRNASNVGDEEVRGIGRGDSIGEDDFEDNVRLLDVFLPRYGLILTVPDDDSTWSEPLDVVEWNGPDCGPYYMLGLDRVPNNVMPLGPMATLRDTADAANRIARKLIRQAERQKDIIGIQGGASEDGERILKAMDGQMIRIDNPASAKQFTYGGPNQAVSAVMLLLQDLFDRYGGNISALGGLSPQAATLGQDELLTGSASKQIEDYRQKTSMFVRDVAYALGWHIWHDPVLELPLDRAGGDQNLPNMPFSWGPLQRTGDYLRFNVDIEPYSMQYSSPGQKVQAIMQMVTGILIPTLPMAAQQGGQMDFKFLLSLLGDYLSLPELSQIMTFGGAPAQERGEMQDETPRKSPTSNRTYTRVGRPGQSPTEGGVGAFQQMMAAGSQAGNLMRSNG